MHPISTRSVPSRWLRAAILAAVAATITVPAPAQPPARPAATDDMARRLGITLVDIPAGGFFMGSCPAAANAKTCRPADPHAAPEEMPRHRVQVRAFQMSRTEVTLGQFKTFIAASGRRDLLTDWFLQYNVHGNDAPVVMVSWNGAQAFVDWLNRTAGGGWRLPTEAEWEYACRAGGQHLYCGGDVLDDLAWYSGNSGRGNTLRKRQQPVATRSPNAFGLHDMSGNVAEWVQDCWRAKYTGAPADGSATKEADCENPMRRVVRGGAWDFVAEVERAAARRHFLPANTYDTLGFRVARSR